MPRLPALIVLLTLAFRPSATAVELPAIAQGKNLLAPAAKPQADAGAKDPSDFPRPPGLVRQTYSQAAGTVRDTEIATYHAETGMDEVAGAYLERLQTAGWKKGSDDVSGSDIHRVRIIEWTTPAKETEIRFYAVKGRGSDLRVRIFTYKTTSLQVNTPTNGIATPLATAESTAIVIVPDVTGQEFAHARAQLKQSGLQAITGTAKTTPDTRRAGNVAGQSPAAGQKVARNSMVTLVPWLVQIPVPNVVHHSLPLAQNELRDHHLEAKTDPGRPTTSNHDVGTVAEQSPAPGELVADDSIITIIPWARAVVVPDVLGRRVEDARMQLERSTSGLHLVVQVAPAKPDFTGGPHRDGLVAEQNPVAGITVPERSTVTLTPWVSVVQVPNVVGQPINQAKTQLERGIHGGHFLVSIAPGRSDVAGNGPPRDNTVAEQSPAGGTYAAPDCVVTLTPWAMLVRVPDVVGKTKDAAQQHLQQAGPGVHFHTLVGPPKVTRERSFDRMVAEQSPAAGGQAVNGSTVTLTLWLLAIPAPNVVGKPFDEAKAMLERDVSGIRFQVQVGSPHWTPEAKLDGLVAEQNPAAAQIVPRGSTITLMVYQYGQP